MRISWEISDTDIQKVKDFIKSREDDPFVKFRVERNTNRNHLNLTRESFWTAHLMCLLTSQQRSGPNSPVNTFLRLKPFPLELTELGLNPQNKITEVLGEYGGIRNYNKISEFASENLSFLESTNWKLFTSTVEKLKVNEDRSTEQEIARYTAASLKGIGPKQSRNLLQAMGLTRYEIPIDSRITKWLDKFNFPIVNIGTALQNEEVYTLVMDGINALCKEAGCYPCVLDAAIFSSFDDEGWVEGEIVF